MNLLGDPIINFFRRQGILLKFVQNVTIFILLLEPERNQNINVTNVATNLITLKLRLFIQRKNKEMTLVDNTLILMNK
jgi:hypothetical protein